jgi:hypothetical protein
MLVIICSLSSLVVNDNELTNEIEIISLNLTKCCNQSNSPQCTKSMAQKPSFAG